MKLFVLFGALAVVFGSAVCFRLEAVAETEPDRIIGGSIARPGQFPFQISLRGRRVVNGTVIFRHRCGGSIISDRWIITAAHCNQREFVNASNSVIVVGAHHIANDGETYQVERIVNHAGYNNVSLQNDISVVLTTRAIQFSATVRPIDVCGKVIGAAEPSIVSGWGVSELPGGGRPPILPDHLKFLEVGTLTNDDCRSRHTPEHADKIYNGTICALLRRGHGACFGDSGGPLTAFEPAELIGLVSWGMPCALGVPDQYTRVSEFTDWITEHTGVEPHH